MWILSKNHPLYSAYALDRGDWKKELKEQSTQVSKLPLMWKSNQYSLRIWFAKWNKVFWIQRLFGRIVKHSHQEDFIKEYTESLEVTHVSHLVTPVKEKEKTTLDTFGLILNESSKQLSLFSVSLKMCQGILIQDSVKYLKTYEKWVTGLRLDYSHRRKRARHILERGFLSTRKWITPTVVHSFAKVSDSCKWHQTYFTTESGRKMQSDLGIQVKMENWPTPSATDYKGSGQSGTGRDRLDYIVERGLVKKNMFLGQVSNNLNGRNQEQLNPAWVSQLMGTTLNRIFFVCSVTEWLRNNPS